MADVLSVRFNGGYYVDEAQFAAIYFVCEQEDENVRSRVMCRRPRAEVSFA